MKSQQSTERTVVHVIESIIADAFQYNVLRGRTRQENRDLEFHLREEGIPGQVEMYVTPSADFAYEEVNLYYVRVRVSVSDLRHISSP